MTDVQRRVVITEGINVEGVKLALIAVPRPDRVAGTPSAKPPTVTNLPTAGVVSAMGLYLLTASNVLTLVGGVAASCLFLILAVSLAVVVVRFNALSTPHAHALQVTLGWLTVLVALILGITRQWTRIYRVYVNGKTERFHHALTD